jgi:site-specific DNA-cytosine methylase
MRVLIACEESDEVRGRFEKLGFDAWSCDIQPNRNANAKHLQCNLFDIIEDNWDAMIAFPPCTHLAVSGAQWFPEKIKDGRQQKGIDFFMKVIESNIKHIAVENPIGIMSKYYKKPDQIIQPYYFGDEAQKTTCLWLKNLPKLYHNAAPNLFDDVVTHTGKGEFFEFVSKKTGKKKIQPMWYYKATREKNVDDRSKVRSKTFKGIADAMANQWGNYLIEKYGM